ncbi:4Fe-4S cluster-binding domain-containing protein [Anaerostipes sp.]|uniref:4Fe-4S cluster-binding domain-containing protein n=1 Tax=Anaerostipes sp. TaxID=1872530 RepID=UPI003966A92F
MRIKGLVDEDFVNYKKPSMFIIFPYCTFKCEKEAKVHCCQNSDLARSPIIEISAENIIERYISNKITKSIVCGGLEPMDSFDDLSQLLYSFRDKSEDDFVIYTGYTKQECEQNGWISVLSKVPNVIIKFGRYIPNSTSHYDDILGINLNSEGQFAERIS